VCRSAISTEAHRKLLSHGKMCAANQHYIFAIFAKKAWCPPLPDQMMLSERAAAFQSSMP
jgi:hypothetical protein